MIQNNCDNFFKTIFTGNQGPYCDSSVFLLIGFILSGEGKAHREG